MAQMQGGLEAARKKFVKEQTAKGVARDVALKRFYVQTRVAELQKAGKPVTPEVRAQLRSNWDSGKVKRAEFGAPGKAAPKKPTVQGPKRTGPETSSTYKKPDRMGPESASYTKPQLKPMSSRTGPETKSYTKPKAGPMGPKRKGPEGPGGMPGRALKPTQMPGGPASSNVSIGAYLDKTFPFKGGNQQVANTADKRRKYLEKMGFSAKDVMKYSTPAGFRK
jgi:hypothetical protein